MYIENCFRYLHQRFVKIFHCLHLHERVLLMWTFPCRVSSLYQALSLYNIYYRNSLLMKFTMVNTNDKDRFSQCKSVISIKWRFFQFFLIPFIELVIMSHCSFSFRFQIPEWVFKGILSYCHFWLYVLKHWNPLRIPYSWIIIQRFLLNLCFRLHSAEAHISAD